MCLSTFHKDKSPNPYGWTVEFYLGFVEVLGDNLLQVVEEMRSFSKAPRSFIWTSIALIPKVDQPESFYAFRPTSLSNCIYKIMAKVLAVRLKALLCKFI